MKKKRYFYITPEDYVTAESNGIKKATLEQRVKVAGWDVERAITQPVDKRVSKTGLREKWKDKSVVCYNTFAYRIRKGMSPEEAASIPFIHYSERGRKQSVFTKEQLAIAAKNGISKANALQRYNACGWSVEDAITIPVMSKKQAAMISVKKRKENAQLKA